MPDLVAASDETLHPIFETVGGNPLALRLVVGQTTVHALPDVLDALRLARGRTVEQLYTFIYRQAWENLDVIYLDKETQTLRRPSAIPRGREEAGR